MCRQMDGTTKKFILRDVTQTQKDKHDISSLHDISYKVEDNHAILHSPRESK